MRSTLFKKAAAFLPVFPLSLIDGSLVDDVFGAEYQCRRDVIEGLLQHKPESLDVPSGQERSLPGDRQFMQSGYYKTMLKRYVFAGAFFCRKKKVLDTCCGLGWGAFLLSHYADSVFACDCDARAVAFCRQAWERPNISWMEADALHLDEGSQRGRFDVVCAMETIEHFSPEAGEHYLAGAADMLRSNGILIGTSSFPADRKRADALCAHNPYHAYIYTPREMKELLHKNFSRYVIIDNWMFIARK
jgi:2-polyprenyl-3-methyl-5-hydroxy-6-metoxy-1,4-benzoquinol methylase